MTDIDGAKFRQTLGHFPTGVTVIAAHPVGHQPVGLTIGSFTSVSMDPPLVGFLPQKTSTAWPFVRDAGAFCVNVLAHGQDDLCWRFAKPGEDKFEGVSWKPAPETASPILEGVLAWIDCRIEEVVDAGDHWFVLGRVMAMDHAEGDPQIFFKGKLGTFHQD
jgi:3-hydroxy-9,10-secoandrosta-1,3,5(10)-triene-9,17-dione monooxygenase reductase component